MVDAGEQQSGVNIKLQLRLVGGLRAVTADGRDVLPRARKSQALLGMLALSPEGSPRSRLATLLWDRVEPDQARNLLRGAVHELRYSLQPVGGDLILATRERLSLQRSGILIDAEEMFRPRADGGRAIDPKMAGLLLLEGLEGIGRAFDDWLATVRLNFQERIRLALQQDPPSPMRLGKSRWAAPVLGPLTPTPARSCRPDRDGNATASGSGSRRYAPSVRPRMAPWRLS